MAVTQVLIKGRARSKGKYDAALGYDLDALQRVFILGLEASRYRYLSYPNDRHSSRERDGYHRPSGKAQGNGFFSRGETGWLKDVIYNIPRGFRQDSS